MNFPCIYQLPQDPFVEGYDDLVNRVVFVETFNRDLRLHGRSYPVQLVTGKLCREDEIIPLENAELPYLGNEFWWHLKKLPPRRVLVKEMPTKHSEWAIVVDVNKHQLDFAARLDELRPV